VKLDLRQIWLFVIGCVIAFVPIVGSNLVVNQYISKAGDRHLDQQAVLAVHNVQEEFQDLIDYLRELSRAAGSSCSQSDVNRMETAILENPAISLLAMRGPEGELQCVSPDRDIDAVEVYYGPVTVFDTGVSLSQVGLQDSRTTGLLLELAGESGTITAFLPRRMQPLLFDRLDDSTGVTLSLEDAVLFAQPPQTYGEAPQARIETRSLPIGAGSMRVQVSIDRNLTTASYAAFKRAATIGATLVGALTMLLIIRLIHYTPAQVNEIERAIEHNEFVPYYQPVIDIESGKLIGCEVLVRWVKPDGTIISPGAFIALAEQTGLAIPMTRKLMETVVRDLKPDYASRPGLKVAINLFSQHFADLDIIYDVEEIFGAKSIPYSQLVLEITERAPLENMSEAKVIMRKLQAMGCRLALDDAGTGHGGLAYLQELGLDIVKIDKMFIDQLGKNRTGELITQTLTELAEQLDMDIVAEGVETMEQVTHLKRYGIRQAQGYLFAPALPARQYLALVKKLGVADTGRKTTDKRRVAARKVATIRAAAQQLAEAQKLADNQAETNADAA
jgi:sensor c-di-GMP phosphodiesterase-like protein